MRLIDADMIEEVYALNAHEVGRYVKQILDSAKTVDAVPVKHGHWDIEISDDEYQATYHCSECGHQFKWIYDPHFPPVFNYCQKCGAYMRTDG